MTNIMESTIDGASTGFTTEESERFRDQKLSDRIGELIDVRLIAIPGFQALEFETGHCMLLPYKKEFSSRQELQNYCKRYHIEGDGHIAYRSQYLREATDDYIVISTRSGGEIGAIKIMMDAVESVWFIGSGVIQHE